MLLGVIPVLVETLDSVGSELGWLLRKEGLGGWMEKMYLRHNGDIEAVSVAISHVSTNLTLKCEKRLQEQEVLFLRNVM